MGTALDEASARLSAIRAAVREHGVADADIATGDISVFPYHSDTGIREGSEASQSLVVTVRTLAVGGVLLRAAATAAGDGFALDRVTLEIADPGCLLEQARQAAFADARTTAEHFAILAGRRLGAVVTIEQESDHRAVGRGTAGGTVALASFSSPVPIEGGQSAVHSSVTVTWRLTD